MIKSNTYHQLPQALQIFCRPAYDLCGNNVVIFECTERREIIDILKDLPLELECVRQVDSAGTTERVFGIAYGFSGGKLDIVQKPIMYYYDVKAEEWDDFMNFVMAYKKDKSVIWTWGLSSGN